MIVRIEYRIEANAMQTPMRIAHSGGGDER